MEGLVTALTGGAWPWANICQSLYLRFTPWLQSTSDRYMVNRKVEQVGCHGAWLRTLSVTRELACVALWWLITLFMPRQRFIPTCLSWDRHKAQRTVWAAQRSLGLGCSSEDFAAYGLVVGENPSAVEGTGDVWSGSSEHCCALNKEENNQTHHSFLVLDYGAFCHLPSCGG